MLVQVVHVVQLLHGLYVLLGEGGSGERPDLALLDQLGRYPVDDLPVLGLDAFQVRFGEHVLDDQEPVFVEPVELLSCQSGHPQLRLPVGTTLYPRRPKTGS